MKETNLSISLKEVYETTEAQSAANQATIAGCIYLAATLSAELNYINDLADSGQQDESDERLAQFNVQLSFKNAKVDIPLNMDTYDYLLSFLQKAAEDADIYR